MSTAQSALGDSPFAMKPEQVDVSSHVSEVANPGRKTMRAFRIFYFAVIGALVGTAFIAAPFAAIYGVQHRWPLLYVAWVILNVAIFAALGALTLRPVRALARRKEVTDPAHFTRLVLAGKVTASIIHEVTQPLGSILVNVDALELCLVNGRGGAGAAKEIISDLKRDVHRANEIALRLRAFLSNRELQLQSIDLNRVVVNVLELLRTDVMRHDVTAHANLAKDRLWIMADAVQLQQVLLTLFTNAMDAMAEIPPASRLLEVTTRCIDKDRVEVVVSDHGPKMTRGQFKHAFDPYFTTKENGMGLGLSIARSIVVAHHGAIWIQRNLPGGASFHVTIPMDRITHPPCES